MAKADSTVPFELRPCHVYVVTLNGTDKSYVGITSRKPQTRWKAHVWAAFNGENSKFYRALRKHGAESFDFTLLCTCDNREDAKLAETTWIAAGWGHYNTSPGGDGHGHVHSDEAKLKMRLARIGVEPWNKGKHTVTEENKQKLREFNAGRKQSSETIEKRVSKLRGKTKPSHTQEVKDKISQSLMGNTPWNKGKSLSADHCKALSLSHVGKKQPPEVIAKRIASTLATKEKKKSYRQLLNSMGPVSTEVILDG